MKFSELTCEQKNKVVELRPDLMADHYTLWMVNHYTQWMADNRPQYMFNNHPNILSIYNPKWMIENCIELVRTKYPQLLLDEQDIPEEMHALLFGGVLE